MISGYANCSEQKKVFKWQESSILAHLSAVPLFCKPKKAIVTWYEKNDLWNLVLKWRLEAIRKWPIDKEFLHTHRRSSVTLWSLWSSRSKPTLAWQRKRITSQTSRTIQKFLIWFHACCILLKFLRSSYHNPMTRASVMLSFLESMHLF